MKQLLYLIVPPFFLLSQCTSRSNVREAYVYLAQADTLLRYDKLQARGYVRQALDIAEKANDQKLNAAGLQKLAATMRYNINLDSLLDCDKKAIAAARNAKDERLICDAIGAYTGDLFQINDLANAQKFLKEHKQYCDSVKSDSCWAIYNGLLGLQYFKMNQPVQAKSFFEQSLKQAEKSNAASLAAIAKIRIFQSNVYSGVFDSISRLPFEAIDYFRRERLSEGWTTALYALGETYFYQGNMKKAIELAQMVGPVFADHQNYMGALAAQSTLMRIATATENLPLLKSSVVAMEKYADLLNYAASKSLAKNGWGQYYSMKGEFDKADKAFAETDSIAEKYNLGSIKAMNTMYKAQNFERQHKTRQTDSMAIVGYRDIRQGRVVSKELIENSHRNKQGNLVDNLERKLMEDPATSDEEVKAFLKSSRERNDSGISEAFVPLLSAFDSSVSLANSRQLLDLETQYRIRIVSDSLKLKNQEAEKTKADLQIRNLIIAGSALLLLLTAVSLWLQIKNRRRAERDKARIQLLQNEIHHRVKNNLAVINRLVDVAGKGSVYDAPLTALKTRIKSIELLHRHLYSEEAKTGNIALQPYFDDLCTAIAATFESAKHIRIRVAADAEVDSTVAEKLGLIVNELVTNSFKYAFDGKEEGSIEIKTTQAADGLNLVVQDNGTGMPEEKAKGSYGMKLIKGLSHELNGKFSFQNDHGTAFQLSIPA